MIIVTDRCFIAAKAIHYVTIQENKVAFEDTSKLGKFAQLRNFFLKKVPSRPTQEVTEYRILINYSPNTQISNGEETCVITLFDKASTYKLFKEIVTQYREQNPDEVFLNKIMESFLEGIKEVIATTEQGFGDLG